MCAAGTTPGRDPRRRSRAGRSAIAPIRQWDTTGWPCRIAGEIPDFNPRALVDDRKLHKLIRRTDLVGLYAAGRAIERRGHRRASRRARRRRRGAIYSDRTGVYVGSGGGNYENQYDYFPLLTAAQRRPAGVRPRARQHRQSDVAAAHAAEQRARPHRHPARPEGRQRVHHQPQRRRHARGDRGAARRCATARPTARVAVGHDAPIEPQMVLYYQRLGLLATGDAAAVRRARATAACSAKAPARWCWRPRRRRARATRRCWAKFWAAATRARRRACSRSATTATASRARSTQALDDAGLAPADVGMIVAHGNGTRAVRRVGGGGDSLACSAPRSAAGHRRSSGRSGI